jgi:hypothetical protein
MTYKLDIVEWLQQEAELVALERLSEAADVIKRLRQTVNDQAQVIERLTRPEGETEEQVAKWLRGRGYEVSSP